MKVSYNWLKEYIDFPYDPEELSLKLTMAGLEVESLDYLGEGLSDIIIGEIVEIKDHPNADKLVVCVVNTGEEKKKMITGAPNVKEGIKVPIAKPGVRLPTGMTIEETRIRGIKSSGMICSEDELGLAQKRQEGIMILPDNYKVGKLFIKEYGLDDYVYKLDLTPNYARCLGMIGIAREIKAMLAGKKHIKLPDNTIKKSSQNIRDQADVEIKDEKLCPRYTGRLIKNVKIKPSPHWMQMRLKAAGIRPVNNIVDITNYVLLEYNQPLHAFDYDTIKDGQVIVRRAQNGESLTTLDGEQRNLDEDVLLIADKEKPLGLAGVMGGEISEVTKETKNVFLESAYFNPLNIRKTAAKFGLHSEASHRFEREVDIKNLIDASNRAAYLMQEYAEGEVVEGVIDKYPVPRENKKVSVDPARVNKLLGIDIERSRMIEMLAWLEFELEEKQNNKMIFSIPSYRNDVEEEADLMEEIARMFGYNNIPVTRSTRKQQGGRKPGQKLKKQIKEHLNSTGLDEVVTFSLSGKEKYDNLQIPENSQLRNWVEIKNPLNKAFAIMRTSLLPGIIEVLSFNAKRNIEKMGIFEIGRVFRARDQERPHEKTMLAGGSMGFEKDLWQNNAADFFYLKGVIENLFDGLKIKDLEFQPAKKEYLHPGRTAQLFIDNENIGYLGELSPEIIDKFNLIEGTTIFNLSLEKILDNTQKENITYNPLPRYPAVNRDLAIVIDEKIAVSKILEKMKDVGGELLENVELFDLYRGQPIPEGKKSLAFKLKFRSREKTLTDSEANDIFNEIIAILESEFAATIRGN
ncbi:MAG: phenylalanine--tRNA ligase subunit beta [Halanaerobiales bacterium]